MTLKKSRYLDDKLIDSIWLKLERDLGYKTEYRLWYWLRKVQKFKFYSEIKHKTWESILNDLKEE